MSGQTNVLCLPLTLTDKHTFPLSLSLSLRGKQNYFLTVVTLGTNDKISDILKPIQEIANSHRAIQRDLFDVFKRIDYLEWVI